MDSRYWHTASPPKTGKIGCGTRTRSRRTTKDTYRSGPARERRSLRRRYRKEWWGKRGASGFKAWVLAGCPEREMVA